MGVIIDYSGSFANEKNEVEDLKSIIESKLSNISEYLNNLKSVWIDEASRKYLPNIEKQIEELNAANDKCKKASDDYMDNIESILNRFGISE